jgi:3-methyladenine DNA glycosylase Tag
MLQLAKAEAQIGMAIPERIDAKKGAEYLDIITRAIFQAGVSWKLVETKWPAFREVFVEFDPKKIAAFTDEDVERLMQDARILRSKKKIDATIKNAQVILELESEFGTMKQYLRSFTSYAQASNDLRKRFKFLGELSAYYLLFRVKEPVPPFEEWITTIEGEHPRMQEMVDHARLSEPSAGR